MSDIYSQGLGWDYSAITDGGPFTGTEQQTHRMQAYCQVNLAGFDITNSLDPYLLKAHIYDGIPFQCELEIDDRDGRVPIPPIGSPVTVALGWQSEALTVVFTGVTQTCIHSFGRKTGGRHMTVTASGLSQVGKIKAPMMDHLGDGAPPGAEMGTMHSLADFMRQAGGNAGASMKIHPFFESVKRDYWAQTNESFMHLGARKAAEFGALFRVEAGNQAVFTMPGQNTDGSSTGTINAIWDDNLIGWRVTPVEARSTWASSTHSYFDILSAQWKTIMHGTNMPDPWSQISSQYALPRPAPNSMVAGQQNQGAAQTAGVDSGNGIIVINGEPTAHFNMKVNLEGARPGVDGIYLIRCAEHMYSRAGYTTTLDVWSMAVTPSADLVTPPSAADLAAQADTIKALNLSKTTP
jgi:phage protein D